MLYIGDEILPSYIGIVISIMECHKGFVSLCSGVLIFSVLEEVDVFSDRFRCVIFMGI